MAEMLFKKVDYTIGKLLDDIEMGIIGLPDIQRPFVWSTTKVRDLFDSMYRGFPIGYLLFWENGLVGEHRGIGTDKKPKVPSLLIVDGQQRLTSLYAVIKGVRIIDKDFRESRIRLAFNPIDLRFEVTNSAIEHDPTWISDISELWDPSTKLFKYVDEFLMKLSEKQPVTEEIKDQVHNAIQNLINLKNYPITALEVSSSVNEEQVAEIFVRINSKGASLNQADFILTLMSVFWDNGRKELEKFCRNAKVPSQDKPSPYNHHLQPSPDQLLRVSVALGFRRARLEHVYSLLRGKDLQTGKFSSEKLEEQFGILRKAQAEVVNLTNWHEFLKVLIRAGYIHKGMISSQIAILYTYALWLIGKQDFGVNPFLLREIMAQWFFMASLTGRYSDSPETRMEQDLALLRDASMPTEFVGALKHEIEAVLTRDYWEVTLPNQLATAAAQSTGQFAYYAALCILDALVLYSPMMKVRQLLDPSIHTNRTALERHHLFPRAYLKKVGIKENRDIQQVANYALVEWGMNVDISDRPPSAYAPLLEKQFVEHLPLMYRLHALPEKWYEMDYYDFLGERRKRMASIIREGFQNLQQALDQE